MSPRSAELIDEAKTPPAAEAERYAEGAAEFLAAVEAMLGETSDSEP